MNIKAHRNMARSFEPPIPKECLASCTTSLIFALWEAGDIEGGIRLYERALSHNAKYSDALYNLGVAFGETGQCDRAVFM